MAKRNDGNLPDDSTRAAIEILGRTKSMKNVLEKCFASDPRKMLDFAAFFEANGGPPYPLGQKYRDEIGCRNRSKWWRSVREKLEGILPGKEGSPVKVDVDSISGLERAWRLVEKGQGVVLERRGRPIGKVVPYKA